MRPISIIGVFIPFFIWLLGVDILHLAPATLVPTLGDTIQYMRDAFWRGEITHQALSTGCRWLIGLLIGVLIGSPLGILLGQFRVLGEISLGAVEYLRSIPVTALIPLFLALFGVGDLSRTAMVTVPTFLLMTVTMQAAVRQVSTVRPQMARSFGATERQIYLCILLPEVLPSFFTALRLAVSLSLVVAIVSEMFVGAQHGIGQRIYESYMTSTLEALFGYLILLGLFGLALNLLAEKLEQTVLYEEVH